MASSVRVTPLYGARTSAPPLCTVLEIDDAVFLLDCGWNDRFDISMLDPLRPVINRGIDAVFLSHPDLAHVGALPYLVGKLGLSASVPVYATTPVQILGQMFLYDAHQHRYFSEEFDTFTLDDVDEAFERVRPVKYQQVIELAQNVFATAYPAGHLLGGSIWKFQKESEEIVYCVDVNHRRERLLNGCASTPQLINKPSHLIVGASGVLTAPSQKKETDLWAAVLETLRAGGDVLMPVDSAGRCLELVLAAEEFWAAHPDIASLYPIVFAQHVGIHTIEFAHSLIEWMSDAIVSAFDSKRENPFRFRHVQVVHGLDQVDSLPSPKVVLTPLPSLDYGFSRVLFLQRIAADPRALVLMSDRPEPGTFAFRLAVEKDKLRQREPLAYAERVPLQGEELERWQREQERARLVGLELGLDAIGTRSAHVTASAAEKPLGTRIEAGAGGDELTSPDAALLHETLGPDFPTTGEEEDEDDIDARYQALVRAGLLLPHEELEPPPQDAYGEVINPVSYMIGEDPGDRVDGGPPFEVDDDNRIDQRFLDQDEAMEQVPRAGDGYEQTLDGRAAGTQSLTTSRANGPQHSPSNTNHGTLTGERAASTSDPGREDVSSNRNSETLPTKLVRHLVVDLAIRCSIRNFDMAGLADGRSLRQLIVSIAPQRVIIIHGSDRETDALAEYLEKKNFSRIFAPRARELMDVSSDTSVYRIKLDDSLLRQCFWRRMQDYEMAWFDGYIFHDDDGQMRLISAEHREEQTRAEQTPQAVPDSAWLAARSDELSTKTSPRNIHQVWSFHRLYW
ncbi:cleavage and polyadenylation specificity factor subunit 2 [Cyanidiococcus yangmingshanensis]|uniref:Cleavage and polyadenylation specificity factor subunit 2 n=1 Tax=Cyanidiococcus yangmingshanensis TaxID=2690220 RepID=A0A7J7INQ6_9RHOD|nr:cleavage and polyadenylation specificity factor subunit 2 [Cyanidiococcus yangmingshanensis]